MNRILGIILAMGLSVLGDKLQAQTTVSFNFSLASKPVSGWINVVGDPSQGVRTATDVSTGMTISSIGTANWSAFFGQSAADGQAPSNGTFFPAAVMLNEWFQFDGNLAGYNAAVPQLKISGLDTTHTYTIRMAGSSNSAIGQNPTRYTIAGRTVSSSIDVNNTNNTANGATFNPIAPDANGNIYLYVNTANSSQAAGISGVQVITETLTHFPPVVTITSPQSGDILAEDGNVTIKATATEQNGAVTKVEFFADATKIGEVLTPPYTMTWINPDAGKYTITAKATDYAGFTSSMHINISIEPLTGFWSLSGNIAANADSNFLGTVDTNRLAFRTNNRERMNILPNGTVSINSNLPDSVNHPAFRVYPNGDLAAGSTMNRNVNTAYQTGLRYYSKLGLLQIGGSDIVDTTVSRIVYDKFQGSGIIMNTDEPNNFKGRIYSSYFSGDVATLDSTRFFAWSIGSGESFKIHESVYKSLLMGWNHTISGETNSSVIVGLSASVTKPVVDDAIFGNNQATIDTSYNTLVSGGNNQFGGLSQLVAGGSLINRTPYGTTLGASNVDFSSLPLTGLQGTKVPNISQYPLLSIGNSINGGEDNAGPVRSNALTVLFNGRTQINTTGLTNTLSQSDVTPKAALDVVSTNSGVLLPRLTTAQRNAIVSGDRQNGLLLYNTDSSAFQYYNGTAWNSIGGAGGQGGKWLFNNGVQYDSLNSVAIGTSNIPQGYKLAVKGAALFTRVQVKAANQWPDYVFNKTYRLRSLEELENYVRKYKHLPEIIPAVKANAEGFDVATHQAVLLKKVEELTLYLIDENKQLKTQTGQIAEQNKKLAQQDKQIADQNARFSEQQRQIDELKTLLKKK